MTPCQQVQDIDALLHSMGATLGGCPGLKFEWSLRVSEGQVSDQDRIICWVSFKKKPSDVSIALVRQLEVLGAPTEILEVQSQLAPHSITQGIGLARSGKRVEPRLYIHHREPETLKNCYKTFRWNELGEVETGSYEFHYLPETPTGETPLTLADPLFEPVLSELLGLERMQQLSGFWLRRRGDRIDQVDLIFPWQPPLSELETQLRSLTALVGAPEEWIKTYREDPVRHLAFSSDPGGKPQFSIYFSAPADESWPDSISALQRSARVQGSAMRVAMEKNIFQLLPPTTTKPNHSLGDFYNSDRVETWRRVLGSDMHYHAGIFEETPTTEIDDVLNDAALRRSVEELYPFLPAEGNVYDIGCGWGGPLQMLVRDLGCSALGITVSRTQFRHCASRGLPVRCGDAENSLPPGLFDCMLLLESFSHIRDKPRLLRVMRVFGRRLVMRVNCQDMAPNSVNFGGTMHMIRSSELRAMIEQAGWRITHWRDRRAEALPSVFAWHQRLQQVPLTRDTHLETLRSYCQRVLLSPTEWAARNPLIEVVAE
jgi:Methionine biosynthesis protein MetW